MREMKRSGLICRYCGPETPRIGSESGLIFGLFVGLTVLALWTATTRGGPHASDWQLCPAGIVVLLPPLVGVVLFSGLVEF